MSDEYVKLDLDGMFDDERKFGRKKKIDKLKIPVGQSRILRIVRSRKDAKFYTVRKQHWGIPEGTNGPPLSCSEAHGGTECYFCGLASEYWNSGDPRKKTLSKRLRASTSVMSNVVDVKDPVNDDGTPKVQLWQYTWPMFQDLMQYVRMDGYGDITHPESGRNFKISAERNSDGPNSYVRYKITPAPNASKLGVEGFEEHLIDLSNLYPPKLFTYDDQKLIAEGDLDPKRGRLPAPSDTAQITAGGDDGFDDEDWSDEFEGADVVEDDTSESSDSEDDSEKRDAVKKKLEELKKVVSGNRK